jgi:DNA repair protein RAD50
MFLQELALLAEAKSDLEIIEKLRVPADRITELCKDIENVKKQVADQEYKLNTRSQGVRTIKEIESELNTLERKR